MDRRLAFLFRSVIRVICGLVEGGGSVLCLRLGVFPKITEWVEVVACCGGQGGQQPIQSNLRRGLDWLR